MRLKLLIICMIISINSLTSQTWTNIFPNPSEFNSKGFSIGQGIDIEHLPTGIYFISHHDGQLMESGIFVKQ